MAAITKTIAVNLLRINSSNDRHGEVSTEAEAMLLLLKTLPNQMRELAKDIAQTGQLFMFPLVRPESKGHFTVFDGNRRLTCLKLLHNPELAPTEEWKAFFKEAANAETSAQLPREVMCLVSEDQDWIDDYLFRIHTGSQNGVGQIRWGNPAKSNFVLRTGKSSKVNLPGVIEQRLREAQLIDDKVKFKHTNLERILSSEEFRSRVGISVVKGHIAFVRDQEKTMNALTRIVKDLSRGKLNLNHLLRNSEKRRYLDGLDEEGVLPSTKDSLPQKIDFSTGIKTNESTAAAYKRRDDKKSAPHHLIRPEDVLEADPKGTRNRATDIWHELKYELKFGPHNNAISVLFRVLLELSIEHYIATRKVPVAEIGNNLGKRFRKVIDHALANDLIEIKYYEGIGKFESTEPLLSANTFNKYVHHKDFFPSDIHLRAMWDTLCPLIKICLSP